MKYKDNWGLRKLNVIVLLKSPDKQIVLTVLQEGTEINSFQLNDLITLQIIEGKSKLHTRKESITLDKDQWLTLQQNLKYSLISKEETMLLLTNIYGAFQPVEI